MRILHCKYDPAAKPAVAQIRYSQKNSKSESNVKTTNAVIEKNSAELEINLFVFRYHPCTKEKNMSKNLNIKYIFKQLKQK